MVKRNWQSDKKQSPSTRNDMQHTHSLVQNCSISIANALGLLQYVTKSSMHIMYVYIHLLMIGESARQILSSYVVQTGSYFALSWKGIPHWDVHHFLWKRIGAMLCKNSKSSGRLITDPQGYKCSRRLLRNTY